MLRVGLAPTFCFWLMYKQNQTLIDLLEPVISAMGYELWGVEHMTGGHDSLVRIYIDSPAGITLADCERASEQITGVLDINDPIRGAYRLEVSSPGLDRPLFTLAQFQRFQGCPVRIRLSTKLNGRRNITGKIIAAEDDMVALLDGDERHMIPADVIQKAHIMQ